MSAKRVFFGVLQKIIVICCTMFFGFANAFSANLPSGYTELEYIESTGTQYINTGVKYSSSTQTAKYDLDFQIVNFNSDGGGLWGVLDEKRSGCLWYKGNTKNNEFAMSIGDTASAASSIVIPSNKNRHHVIFEAGLTAQNNTVNINYDNTLYTGTYTYNYEKLGVERYIFLFYGYASDYYHPTAMKVYNFKIYLDNTLVRDFVPAKNSSGVVGMYDTVSGTFFTNAGTGTFDAGPVVLNPCRNLFDKDAMIHGAYVFEDGTEKISAQYCYSNYIPVTPGQTYTFSAVRNQSGSNKRIHAYDSNKNWIQQLGLSPLSSSVGPYAITVTIPSGISYILISGMRCDVDVADTNMQLEQGSTATAYVPYCATPIKIATTAYNAARFNQVKTDLNSAVATIREIVTKTINQTAAIASLQADKQTRPEDACPAGKKCLLVETEENGVIVPHWFPIIEDVD